MVSKQAVIENEDHVSNLLQELEREIIGSDHK